MENQKAFPDNGNWYKGNLHSHSTNSDGCLTPEESVALFKENGYHFLCLSEHDLYTNLTEELSGESFLLIPGVEASAVLYEEESANRIKLHHIHGILGTREMQEQAQELFREKIEPFVQRKYYGEWNGQEAAQELVDTLTKKGCFTIYNHPIWSKVDGEDFLNTEGLIGMEIFNYNTVNESGTGYDVTYWDALLRKGKRVYGFASDDNHNEGFFDDACGGYIVVKAKSLTHDDIITAIMKGDFYSSAGPEIYDWGIQDNRVYVKCSPVNRVNFIAGNYVNAGTTVLCDTIEETMEEASFVLKGDESYIRIECIDKNGKTAWSNPIFLK
ncbi:MAG: PHP domain-containing protein [Eubacteriales bacterium]